MADHVLTLELDDDTHARLAAEAAKAGLSLEAWARRRLAGATQASGVREDSAAFEPVHDWTEADRRLARYDRTGEYIDAETALDAFVAEVKERASRRG